MKRSSSLLVTTFAALLAIVGGCELAAAPDGTLLNGTGGSGASGDGGRGGDTGPGGAGGLGGMGGGGGQPCNDPSECPGQDDACETRTCEEGVCGLDFVADGTAIPQQAPGDCQVVVCDGAGATKGLADDTDILDDNNECTTDTCDQGVPVNADTAAGSPCTVGGKVCDGIGACVECVVDTDCMSLVCAQNTCIAATCIDTVKNANETDIDCGGPDCLPCNDNDDCLVDSDCQSGVCDPAGLTCTPPTCVDSVKNQDETDTDCGGATCPLCGPGLGCAMDGDCAGGSCVGSICAETCTDGVQNQDETDADCGGLICNDCLDGDNCLVAADCVSNFCNAQVCAPCTGDADCAGNEYCSSGTCLGDLATGVACGNDAQCLTGQCEDGVCCNVDCSGLCQACAASKTGGVDGTCAPVTSATDPDNECALSQCTTGACDGIGACGTLNAGTSCGSPLSCAGSTQTNQDTCDGTGVCTDNLSTNCAPYVCGATSCKTSCTVDADCLSGNYCAGGACVPQKAQGAACALGNECAAGNCVDGFCCNNACGSLCQACSNAKTGAANGTCANIVSATDPDNECATAACQTGTCNGSGACGNDPSGTSCGSPLSCSGSTQTNQDTCNGTGTCTDNLTTNCAPYVCGATSCKTSCAADADCTSGNFCSGTACVPKKAQGAACVLSNECSLGNCVDGFCCNNACGSLCQACSNAKTGAANGTCANIVSATDPDNECATAACQTGTCNGSGACGNDPSGTSCGSPLSCSGSTQTNQDTCNGTGTCTDNLTTNCAPYVCGATTCKTSCTVDADCTSGNFCSGTSCVAKKAQGATCTLSNECSSGNCVDGFCCNSACGSTCQACSNAKTGAADGTCASVVAATDPDSECPSTACKTGTCDGSGACGNSASGSACGDVLSCTVSTQTNADACDGAGNCTDNGTTNCSPYGCGGAGSCNTTCVTAADCAPGGTCLSGVCALSLAQGAACSLNAECASGSCVDGVCCESSCSGSCQACSNAKTGAANGTCASVLANTDPDGECPDGVACQTGLCDGVGACGNTAGGTTCGDAQSCFSGIQTNQDLCNGAGSCVDNGFVSCGTFACGALTCLSTCVLDSDCASGNYCSGGSCIPQQIQGSTCTVNNQCASGSCADGFCCDSACTGSCQACAATKTGVADGTCATIPVGTDPDSECPSITCKTGTCNGAGACGNLSAGSLCGSFPGCSSGVATLQDSCDGAGTCADAGTVSCGAYACSGSTCGTTCNTNADCGAGFNCDYLKHICVTQFCGDGTIQAGEACDDGNVVSYDGCSTTCAIEPDASCSGTPSTCTIALEKICNDSLDNDGDGLTDCADPNCALACDTTNFGTCAAGETLVTGTVNNPKRSYDVATPSSLMNIGVFGKVTKAALKMNAFHSFDSDLDIALIAPSGQSLDLSSDNGSSGDNYINTILSDTCSTLVTAGVAPMTGCFKPEALFSTLTSGAKGTWKLNIGDDASTDTGYLINWTLAMCVNPTLNLCGNGILDPGEACDDNNNSSNDGCNATCSALESGFSCVLASPTTCLPVCGDNIVSGTRDCEDGNAIDGDGCSSACLIEPGYGCFGTPSTCVRVCGDGFKTSDEACDDGNRIPGDGCDAACALESAVNELEPNDSFANADTNAAAGFYIGGTSTMITGFVPVAGNKDFFKMILPTASTVRFETFDFTGVGCTVSTTTINLFNSAQALLYTDQTSGFSSCSSIVVNLAAGTYYVQFEEAGNNAVVTNGYKMQIKIETPFGSEAELNDTTATANLIVGNDIFENGGHQLSTDVDHFKVVVGALTEIRTEIIEGGAETCESNEVDSKVSLLNSAGTSITSDDNVGRGNCSLLEGQGSTEVLTPGVYYLKVESTTTTAVSTNQFDYKAVVSLR